MKDKTRLVIAGTLISGWSGLVLLGLHFCYEFNKASSVRSGILWIIAGWIGALLIFVLFLIGLGLIFIPIPWLVKLRNRLRSKK